MGGAASSTFNLSPSFRQITSGKELILKTTEVSAMADELFTFMYTQYELNEVWDIIKEPEKYIIELSSMIENHFDVIGIGPAGSSGEIYFKRFDTLKKKVESDLSQHKKNAQIIAFYFIRIFQILGAMLLVIRDTPLDINIQREPEARRIGFKPNALPRTFQQGGGVPSDVILGPFEFLRNRMNPASKDDKRIDIFRKDNVSLFKLTENLFFQYTPIPSNVSQIDVNYVNTITPLAQFILCLRIDDRCEKMLPIPIVLDTMTPYSVANKVFDKYSSNSASQIFPSGVSFYIKNTGSRTGRPSSDSIVTVERVKNEVSQEDDANFYSYRVVRSGQIVNIISLLGLDPTKNFSRILEAFFLSYATNLRDFQGNTVMLCKKDSESGKSNVTKSGVGKEFKPSEIGIPSIRDGYTNLIKGKDGIAPSGAHCIKRASQLLDGLTIELGIGNKNLAYTNICKFSAPDVKEESISLENFFPTKSVGKLFGKVDPLMFNESLKVLEAFVRSSSEKDTTLPVSSLESQKFEADSLTNALKRLRDAFEASNTKGDLNSLNDIVIKKPSECSSVKKESDGKILLTNNNMINSLQKSSRELLAYHVNHTIEITKFLKTVFNIKQRANGSWEVKGVNYNVLFAGFPILNTLTDQARELLVDYYTGCENIYQKGVSNWKGFVKENMPAPAAAVAVGPVEAAGPVEVAPAAAAAPPAIAPAANKGGRRY